MKKSNTVFLNNTTIALTNAQRSSEILNALIQHGADQQTIKQLSAQLQAVNALEQQYDDITAEAKAATHTLNTVRDQGNKMYGQHVLLARVAFKDQPVWLAKMELEGQREKALPAWLKQASSLYRHAPAVQETLTAFQVPTKEVAEMRKLLTQMVELQTLQVDLKGSAQVISEQKKQAYTVLRKGMARFFRIARIAFEAQPQHLEVLGLPVKASV